MTFRRDALPAADVYVFQKLVDVSLMRRLRDGGALIIWDVCDPAWWFNPGDAGEASNAADAVVASCGGLAGDFEAWSGRPARMIPDRLLLSHFTHRQAHTDRAPVRLIWFGAAQNRIALLAAVANLSRLRANGYEVTLTIADNAPETAAPWLESELPVYYTRWTLDTEAETLAAHDIALLPPYPGPWGAVKSNNKTLTAWAAGLPVSSGLTYDTLEQLVKLAALRQGTADDGRLTVKHHYNVEQSAADWLALVEELQHGAVNTLHRAEAVQV